jgi:deoxycytidylate deaminase
MELGKSQHNTGMPCSQDKFTDIVELLTRIAQNSNLVHKHSACLLWGDKVYAVGVNKYFGVKADGKPIKISIHAEEDAIINCNSKLSKGMDILVIRIGKSNKLRYSRPCNSCIDKLDKKGIRKAYYSDLNGNIVYEFIDNMPKQHNSSGCVFRKKFHKTCL